MELRTIVQPNKRQRSVTIILTRRRGIEGKRGTVRVYVYMRAGQSIDDGIDRRRERATAIDTGDVVIAW